MLCPICKSELPKETVIEGQGSRQCTVCGASLDKYFDETESVVLEKIGRFTILHTLGEGGFGTVYKARDAKLDRIVAIKVLRPGKSGKPDLEQRLIREAKAASLLQHPGIVKVFDLEELGPIKVLIEEYVDGDTLDSLIKQDKLKFREKIELVARLADALDYAHRHKVVHRDIKPANIMLDSFGQPRILDFGLAKREGLDVSMTEQGQIIGTIVYMSPEQAQGNIDQISGASDQYSLGVILYQLITGELPFRGSGNKVLRQIITSEPPNPRSLSDAVTKDLDCICMKAMANKISDRYSSCGEFAAELRRYLNNQPIKTRPIGVAGKLERWARRNQTLAASLAAIAAILLLATAVSTYFAIKSSNDLHERLVAEKETEKKQIQLLQEADAAEVRPVVLAVRKDLAMYEQELQQIRNDPQLDKRRLSRVCLALCEKHPELVNQLYSFIDQLPPAELLLANDLITVPPSEVQENALWTRLKNQQSSAQQRLMAAVVLAKARPQHPSWNEWGRSLVNDLLDPVSSLQLSVWLQPLKPLWPLLQNPLIEECTKKGDAQRSSMALTIILQLYPREIPVLTRVLGDLPQSLAPSMISHLKSLRQNEHVLAALKNIYEPGASRAPLINRPVNLPDASPLAKQLVEKSSGIIHDTFAMTASLAWPDVDAILKELASAGYRPVRFRPYTTSQGLRVAAIWYRDAIPKNPHSWDFAKDLSLNDVQAKVDQCKNKSLQPIELACYVVEPQPGKFETRYIWISVPTRDYFPVQLASGVREENYPLLHNKWMFGKDHVNCRTGLLDSEKGILPVIHTVHPDASDQTTVTQLVSQVPLQRGRESYAPSFVLSMQRDLFQLTLADFNLHHDVVWVRPEAVQKRLQYFQNILRQSHDILFQDHGNSHLDYQAMLNQTRASYELGELKVWSLPRALIINPKLVLHTDQAFYLALSLARAGNQELAKHCAQRSQLLCSDIRIGQFIQSAVALLTRDKSPIETHLSHYQETVKRYPDNLSRYWYARLLALAAEVSGKTSQANGYAEEAFRICELILKEGVGPGYELDQFWSRDFASIADKLEPIIQQKRQQLHYCATWSPARGMNQQVQHGETIDLALPLWNSWMNQGYIPHTISAVEWQGKTRLLTTWRIARPTVAQDTQAANRKANALLAQALLQHFDEFWKALENPEQDNLAVELAHELIFRVRGYGLHPHMAVLRLQKPGSSLFRQRLLMLLGQYSLADLGSDQQQLLASLSYWLINDSDAGVHSTCDWLLRTWKQDALIAQSWKNQDRSLKTLGKRSWFKSAVGYAFTIFNSDAPILMGISIDDFEATFPYRERPNYRKLDYTFAVSMQEVSKKEFLQFKSGHDSGARVFSPNDDCSVGNVSWHDAARFCNYLSEKEGIPRTEWCYEPIGDKNQMQAVDNYLLKTGYRLPMEAEFEFACRGHSRLVRFFGNSPYRLNEFAWYRDNSGRQMHPPRLKLPNPWGLFDIYGNAQEWTSERMDLYPATWGLDIYRELTVQLRATRRLTKEQAAILRGTSWGMAENFVRSSQRGTRNVDNSTESADIGFRVARTIW